jgi:hypothetical protein
MATNPFPKPTKTLAAQFLLGNEIADRTLDPSAATILNNLQSLISNLLVANAQHQATHARLSVLKGRSSLPLAEQILLKQSVDKTLTNFLTSNEDLKKRAKSDSSYNHIAPPRIFNRF